MTIDLPETWRRYVREQVEAGRFASADAVILDALRHHQQAGAVEPDEPGAGDPLLGAMRDDADLLDSIVDQAMINRRDQPWRLPAGE